MAFEYINHLTGCYSLSFVEKFNREDGILPQWVGWYNPYDYSFSYEYWDADQLAFVRRVIPNKIKNVQEFGIIDLGPNDLYTDRGLIVYRQQDSVYWLIFQFGNDLLNREDVVIDGPHKYTNIVYPYYLYVHEVTYTFQGRKLTYVFTTEGNIKIYYFWQDDPGTLYEVDTSNIQGWNEVPLLDATNVRISKAAFMSNGKHSGFYFPNSSEVINYSQFHILSVDASFDTHTNTTRFMSNLPSVVYYVDGTRIPTPGFDPFVVLSDRVIEGGHIFHQAYIDTSTFIEGVITYKSYETDLEWVTKSIAIMVEAGGFAFILFI